MKILGLCLSLLVTGALPALASSATEGDSFVNLTGSGLGIFALILFVAAYTLVIFEEQLHMRKSKPVLLVAGIIWVLVAISYAAMGDTHTPHEAIKHNLIEYAELFLFLLAAMTYINAMDERNVFQALRSWLVSRGFTLRTVFWVTGVLSFFISPLADNLTTALLMGAVVMAVGGGNRKFVIVACINVVVAANAGGAFSPFGDITTLMVWQKGKVAFIEFFAIFIPSLVNWIIPAVIMSMAVSKERPEAMTESISMKLGAKRIVFLFLCTITTAVSFHNFLHLPPATGMMLGLGYLGFFSYWLKKTEHRFGTGDQPLDMTGHNPDEHCEIPTVTDGHGHPVGNCRQYSGDVCCVDDGPGDVTRAVVAGHFNRWGRRQHFIDRFSCRCRTDGHRSRCLYFRQPSEMVLGHCSWVRGKYPCAPLVKRQTLLIGMKDNWNLAIMFGDSFSYPERG